MTTNTPTPQPIAKSAVPELSPCRFCGRTSKMEQFFIDDDPQPWYIATCSVCPVKTYDQRTAEEAARIWNASPAGIPVPQSIAEGGASPEPEPCPFCGGVRIKMSRLFLTRTCGDCHAVGPLPRQGEAFNATRAWNRRAKPAEESK